MKKIPEIGDNEIRLVLMGGSIVHMKFGKNIDMSKITVNCEDHDVDGMDDMYLYKDSCGSKVALVNVDY